jgi:acetoin utilization deacetylase AcuC-like enzyme
MKLFAGRDGEHLRAFYSDQFPIPLPPDHRFPIDKYRLLRQAIIADLTSLDIELLVPDPACKDQIRLVHDADYVEKVITGTLGEREIRRIGFPWSPELVIRSQRSVGGTIAACRTALQAGVSVNLAGGTHHAHRNFGSGFCLLNDCAVAIKVIQQESPLQRVIVLDCDVHQGDGTAAIFSSDPDVFTFSIHGARNFPFHKVPSDLDIALEDGTADSQYLQTLENGLAEIFKRFKGEFVLYLAGADPYYDDRLGLLALTKNGLAERDRLVLHTCQQAGLPVAIVMAGGYARNVADTVAIHQETIRQAADIEIKQLRTKSHVR